MSKNFNFEDNKTMKIDNLNKNNTNENISSIEQNLQNPSANFETVESEQNQIIKYEQFEKFKNSQTQPKVKWFELLFLICNMTVIISIFIFSKEKNYLSFICSIFGCFAIWLLAKGFYFAPLFNSIYDSLYIILSFTQCYFGEAIIYLVLTLPIDIISIFSWKRNKSTDSDIVKFNKIHKKEFSLLTLCIGIITIGFSFLLKALGTDQLFFSTLSLIPSAYAGYLLFRRNNFYSLAYSVNDIVVIILWSISLTKYGISNLPIVINQICCLAIDFYGFINLQKEIKKQSFQNEKQI